MREIIKNLYSQQKTVVVASHILTELTAVCTDVLILKKGSMVFFGSVEHLNNQAKSDALSLEDYIFNLMKS